MDDVKFMVELGLKSPCMKIPKEKKERIEMILTKYINVPIKKK